LKSIQPPKDVLDAMEKQMRAEREKRANVLTSEADRDSKINRAEGEKQETIKASEADRQKQINEAEGKAQAILAVANATAEGLRQVAIAMSGPGGEAAAKLKIAEEYVKQFGQIAYDARAIIVPSNVGDPSSMIAFACCSAAAVCKFGKPAAILSTRPARNLFALPMTPFDSCNTVGIRRRCAASNGGTVG
jgi:regulator of protease activity HflC (stomatin/prohibitin superfamily)